MSFDRLPLQSHPNGREQGEGVYVARTNNSFVRGGLFEYITTNVRTAAPLTRELLEQTAHWSIWSLR